MQAFKQQLTDAYQDDDLCFAHCGGVAVGVRQAGQRATCERKETVSAIGEARISQGCGKNTLDGTMILFMFHDPLQ